MEEVLPEGGFAPLRLLGKDAHFLEYSTPNSHQDMRKNILQRGVIWGFISTWV